MQIFPKEIIDNTVQSYIPRNTVKSRVIYGVVLLTVLFSIAALPFVRINVYTSARGIVKPTKERIPIKSLNSGKVLYSNIENNRYVKKGEVLLILESNILDEQLDLATYDSNRYTEHIKDLEYFLNSTKILVDSIRSTKYRKEYYQYLESSDEHKVRIKKKKIDHDRSYTLFQKGVIATADYENVKLEYDLALSAHRQFKKRQINTWQSNLIELKNNQKNVQNKSAQYLKRKKDYIITAPTNGSLVNLSGVEKGSTITSGFSLAEISPDTDLVAECYVSPLDIGLIDKSKPVNFQIDAFNYNQWGLATGSIMEISKDVELMDNQPVFKLRCKLHEKFLQLKNGAKGTIGKGMTLNARFELTERTLFQLLYDKVDDWMNPSQHTQITSMD